jgi:hypothetical protein
LKRAKLESTKIYVRRMTHWLNPTKTLMLDRIVIEFNLD